MEYQYEDDGDGDYGYYQAEVENGMLQQMMPSVPDSAVVLGRVRDRKMFIGGLSIETTERDLEEYFKNFGSVDSVNVKVDHSTGISKGFGFVLFNNAGSVAKVVAAGEHVINNKKVDAKVATERNGKIFVGGIANAITAEDIRLYFSQFGNIVGVEMPIDKTANKHKNFCFVIFESEEVAKKVVKRPKQTIKNKQVEIKPYKANQVDNQRSFDQNNAAAFGQNWGQSYGNQTYGGESASNYQQGYVGGVYGAAYTGYEDYDNTGYESYVNNYQNTANRGYGVATGRRPNRGGFRGRRGGTYRGRGNLF